MATKAAANDPLDKLQTQVDSVLFQLGKVFKHAHGGDTKALHQAKIKAQKGIPDACSVFHDSLDSVEQDLRKARAAIERDLTLIQNKRAAREKAASAARLQANAANKSAAANGQPVKKEPGTSDASKGDTEMAGQSRNGKAVKAADGQSTARSGAETAVNSMPTDLDADLESIFADGLTDPGMGDASGGVSQQADDTQGSIEALFGDDMDFDGNFGLNTSGGEDDINNLIPGLEKYSNQGQDSGSTANAGANGQNAGVSAEEFDLEKLLSDIGDNSTNEDKSSSNLGAASAKEGDKSKGDDSKPADNSQASNTNGSSEEKKTEEADTSGLIGDAEDIDMSFAFDFMDAGDGAATGASDDLNDFFNFN